MKPRVRFGPINPIAWMIGHLAWQEQLYWLERAQGTTVVPEVKQFGYGKPLSVPPLDEAWGWWRTVTRAADPYLDQLAGSRAHAPVEARDFEERRRAPAAPHDLPLLVPPGRVAGGAADAGPDEEATRLRRQLPHRAVPT